MDKPGSAVSVVARTLQDRLFPDAKADQIADAYAQTVTFALLLARAEGATLDTLDDAAAKLEGDHLLLGEVLGYFTKKDLLDEVRVGVTTLQRVIRKVEPKLLRSAGPNEADDPWLYFYEDFLSEYDPKLRNEAGAYYTPLPVVRCQVRLIDRCSATSSASPAGSPTRAWSRSTRPRAPAPTCSPSPTGRWTTSRTRATPRRPTPPRRSPSGLHGFEFMVGPYAVAQLRLTLALSRRGASLADAAVGVYLTNSLADPFRDPPHPQITHPG